MHQARPGLALRRRNEIVKNLGGLTVVSWSLANFTVDRVAFASHQLVG